MAKTATVLITFAAIMGPVVLVTLSLSFATDKWLEFTVERQSISNKTLNSPIYKELKYKKVFNSRYRGLFRECFPGPGIVFPLNTPGLTDEYCFEMSYKVPDKNQISYSLAYWQRIHLMRTHMAFLIIAIVTYLSAYIFGIAVCCSRASKWALFSTIFTYTTAFSTALAMACFHGMEYLERNKIDDKIGDLVFQRNWPAEVLKATSKTYGYSYALGWVSMILSAITGTFYAFAAWSLKGERYDDKLAFDTKSRVSDFAYTNYPMVATISDPVYNPYEDPRILYGYPEKRGPPAIAYDHSGREMWHWAS